MKPSAILALNRDAIRAATARYRTLNPRVFGSAARGADHEGSDLDLLVDTHPDTTLFDLGGLQIDLETQLGIKVDLLTPGDLPSQYLKDVLDQARSV